MASSPLANFLSLFIPTKAPPTLTKSPPSHLSLSSESKDGLPPLISSGLPAQKHSTASSSNSDLMSVVCPSFAYANTLYFKSAYNVQIVCDEEEPDESIVQRFRREVFRAGVIQEARRRRFHETNQEKVKRKAKEAARRNRRRRTPFRPQGGDQPEFAGGPPEEELDEGHFDYPE